MPIGLYFQPSGFTPEVYDQVLKRLDDAGAGAPKGRLYHVAMEHEGSVQVFDVWDSDASFQAFGETLIPIMQAAGVDPGEPMVSPIRNIIKG